MPPPGLQVQIYLRPRVTLNFDLVTPVVDRLLVRITLQKNLGRVRKSRSPLTQGQGLLCFIKRLTLR